jgi:proteic killer suppression protein
MKVAFKDARLCRTCNDRHQATRLWGGDTAKALALRLQQLAAAETLADLRYAPGRYHELKGSRAGQLATDLHHGKRLVFEPAGAAPRKADGGLDWQLVTAVLILEVVDYHG